MFNYLNHQWKSCKQIGSYVEVDANPRFLDHRARILVMTPDSCPTKFDQTCTYESPDMHLQKLLNFLNQARANSGCIFLEPFSGKVETTFFNSLIHSLKHLVLHS